MMYLRSEVAKLANINVETLRYYEKKGLILIPERNTNGYRLYNDETITRLKIIKYSKACGFTLEEIKEIMLIFDRKELDYTQVTEFIYKKTKEINEKINQLSIMKDILYKIQTNIANKIECPIKNSFNNI